MFNLVIKCSTNEQRQAIIDHLGDEYSDGYRYAYLMFSESSNQPVSIDIKEKENKIIITLT